MKHHIFSLTFAIAVCVTAATHAQDISRWDIKGEAWPNLVRAVPGMLGSQDMKTGRFGSGIWVVNDQNLVFPLAVAWGVQHPANPFYHRADLLTAIMAGGDALVDDQDEKGQWEFRKKDGSTWGKIYMPWTYSRWVRAFGLIRDAMPAERRARWEQALALGYTGIARSALGSVHNIPAHHAMGLYHAGQLLQRPEWCQQAKAFLARVCEAQNPGGYWSEHQGPVVAYNFVYTEALGIYHAMAGDVTVLPALQRSARFHAAFTYPDGSHVETVDERNPYERGVSFGTVGFTCSTEGRRFLWRQLRQLQTGGETIGADEAATLILYAQEGPLADEPAQRSFVLGENDAATQYRQNWFVCLSAFHCPVEESRWIQDRQNVLSLFHDRTGLIVGGGNTKLQPAWSTFVVGDRSLLAHRPGDTQPKFTPPPGIWHVPSAAELSPEQLALQLRYGSQACHVRVEISDPRKARLIYEATAPLQPELVAHVTLLPHVGEVWETASGTRKTLDESAFHLAPGEAGDWFAHHGWRISVPAAASIRWPVLPHNPYRKDGHATASEGRIVLELPFRQDLPRYEVTVEVPPVSP